MSIEPFPPAVRFVLQRLLDSGWQAYLVGGSVRDRLLNRPVRDYDIATDASATAVIRLFDRTSPTGLRYGTVTVHHGDVAIEVTTLRVDGPYADHRRPRDVRYTARLEDDLARRDFTINAMAMDIAGRLVDPYGGQRDLADGVVRAVGDATQRLQEDALRILRALRLAAELEWTLEDKLLTAIDHLSPGLAAVAPERLGAEWARIGAASWWRIAPVLAQTRVLSRLPAPWPSLRAGFAKLAEQSWMSTHWRNAVATCDACTWTALVGRCQPSSALAAALWCHASAVTGSAVDALWNRSGWKRKVTDFVRETVAHMGSDPAAWNAYQWRRALYDRPPAALLAACVLLDRGGDVRANLFTRAFGAQPIRNRRDLALSGHDLRRLGLLNADIGRLLQTLADRVLDGTVDNAREPLLRVATHLWRQTQEEAQQQ